MKISELFEDTNSSDYGLGYDDCFTGSKSEMFDSSDYMKGWNDCAKNGEYNKGQIATQYNTNEKSQGGYVDLIGEEYADQPLGYMEVKFDYKGEYADDEYRNSIAHVVISDGDENLVFEDYLDSNRFDKFLKDLESDYGIKGYWTKRMNHGMKEEPTPFTNKLESFFKEYETYFNNG